MSHVVRSPKSVFVATALALIGVSAGLAASNEPQAQPNPYRIINDWAKLPEGRTWGQVATVDIGRNGSVWILERCGKLNCIDSKLDPIIEFDASGKFVKSCEGSVDTRQRLRAIS